LFDSLHFRVLQLIYFVLGLAIQMQVLDSPFYTVWGRVHVFHRGFDVLIPHQVLDRDQVYAISSQPRSVGMPQMVRRSVAALPVLRPR
jgi:hypothetical protein